MISANSKNNVLIRLTDERTNHIFEIQKQKIASTGSLKQLKNQISLWPAISVKYWPIKLYAKTPVTLNKFLTIVYKENNELDGFILTAYFSRSINKKRRVIWKP